MQARSKVTSSICSSGEADEQHAAQVELWHKLSVDDSAATISQTGCFVNCRWLQMTNIVCFDLIWAAKTAKTRPQSACHKLVALRPMLLPSNRVTVPSLVKDFEKKGA
jgi:hypothetical protein